jgi:hypothetical protein
VLRVAKALMVLAVALGLMGASRAWAFDNGGGWGWGGWGWGDPNWVDGWNWPYTSDYAYGNPKYYGSYGYPSSASPARLYCFTRVRLCSLSTERQPGADCLCDSRRGRVGLLRGKL